MTRLSVNVNKVATLRNTRALAIPSPAGLARIALEAGAHGITVHPRPDQRHIRPADVREIAALLRGHPRAELNIEGNPFPDPNERSADTFMAYAEELRPAQCTLVPDSRDQSTSDHGWDLAADGERLRPIVARLRDLGCRVSLFLDAEGHADLAADVGAHRIELYTEPYAAAHAAGRGAEEAAIFARAAESALARGLEVNAGHDLNRDNLPFFLRTVKGVSEVSIGHALVADALELGMGETVRQYLAAIASAAQR
jgi:pyridoxine 5-phosphate synthase